jgi:hypothetical protein
MSRLLREVAHSRAGDKGDTSILLLRCYLEADFPALAQAVTTARVAVHFGVAVGAVTVVPVPGLRTLTLVVRGALAGGVTRSPRIDPHGKTLSGHLLDLQVPWPE